MIITTDLLRKHNACKKGVDAFNSIFPNGFDTSEWTKKKQIELYKTELRRYIMWAVSKYLLPLWSMYNANLSGANLSWADLFKANLPWANLSEANLSGANLFGANLSGANLFGANLSGADLSGAIGYTK